MPVLHVVMLTFKDDIHPKEIQSTITRMLNLKTECLHPGTARPYIISLRGGRENSIEGLQNGLTHIFVMEFQTTEDRNYYVRADPAHLLFAQSIVPVVAKTQVVDFAAGVW
ncbi:stress responsive A/B barrel domain protein [Talaromyces proteolyticus]|uniref:Stress responsive A/B barrel domain protein n=1 Tax=Talaromyces proteolyticus TaxID=1131652 RepID=A0AAD4PRZ6_9EURO|nr:stress responsive A/B barrel domain protein [Talaromyces proteolyticus]KAH8690115.1 stress responsive A/B barrel domain protein [Talaromyces proteolyticus]